MDDVLLSAIAYELGTLRTVSGPAGEALAKADISDLYAKGVDRFCQFDEPITSVIRRCIDATLAQSTVARDTIGTVIFVTESFGALGENAPSPASDRFRWSRECAFELIAGAGLRHANVICSTYGGCTNLSQALIQAEALITRGLSATVLVVAAEQYGEVRERLMSEAMSLASDGVAACLIGRAAAGVACGFRIVHVATAVYRRYVAKDMARLILEMFRAMRNAAADCYDACNLQPRDFRWLVLGNYNHATSLTHGKLLGFTPERVFLGNVGKFGHVPFDTLISLGDLLNSEQAAAGDRILMFMCGPISCAAVVVELVANNNA